MVTPSGPFIRENRSIIYNVLIALYGILITWELLTILHPLHVIDLFVLTSNDLGAVIAILSSQIP